MQVSQEPTQVTAGELVTRICSSSKVGRDRRARRPSFSEFRRVQRPRPTQDQSSAILPIRSGLSAVFLGLIILSGGCGAPPRIAPLNSDSIILAFGDSLTAGDDADRKNSYPALLQELLGCKVINAGIPGEVSSQGLKRLPLELDKCDPQLVILCHGGNDLLGDGKDAAIAKNLEAMVRIVSRRGANVILVGVPRPGLRLKTAEFYRETADRFRIPCDTKTIADILSHPSLKADQIHPNAAGNRRLAEALASLINKCQPK